MTLKPGAPKIQGKPCKNCGGTERYPGSYSCVACAQTRSKARKATDAYKHYAKRYWMEKRYGMTLEEFETRFKLQGECCKLCKTIEPNHKHGWMVDHNHETGEIRGILCNACNVGLGAFKDDPNLLALAMEYLK